ncbi:hypothetical protein PGUG_04733 [Meyerozyma guilliermondii ATCC 6260]|uniref:DNA-directed RNA polymerase n=1 Tax=Meyerozyma guilliermondii (strain ATCC 6260 / CBS 566 / DSM 6381 / JCM 1539 / NBRC 10279 / NRRL Y-324) TaxID=294746 RepID=A5DN82_PICGU|nr:uncharacterized protein PGUG_04733 [Meyerozyma guilliermondii ATCC 6260]EDK40635.2 hypothetical protein PGUG_04733 [Meyerozyma guilliermondii ATCC 6260]
MLRGMHRHSIALRRGLTRNLHKSNGGLKSPSVASTTVHKSDRFGIYDSVLEDLKNKKDLPNRNGVHNKAFSNINSKTLDNISEKERQSVAWSSRYDPVSRSPFAKDIVHLQSLLDALLASKNFDRADKILKAIYPISPSSDDFLFSLNRYLEGLAQEDITISELESYLEETTTRFPHVQPNDRTYAILLSKSMSNEDKFSHYLARAKSARVLRKVFNHLDILGVDGLTKIFNQDSISEHDVPSDLRPLFHQANASKEDPDLSSVNTPEYFKNSEQVVPVVDKDAAVLRAVDSFGLKVIRHTLLGLQAENNSPVLEEFISDIESELGVNVLHNVKGHKKDYFAVYRSLKSDEQRQKFNEALDLFNESRQRQLELRGVDGAREKWKHEYEEMQKRGAFAIHKNLNVQLFKWYSDMLPYVEKEAKICRKIVAGELDVKDCKPEEAAQMKERSYYAPYMILVPPKKMAVITILELLKLNSTGGIVDGMRTARAVISVGKALELEYKSQNLVEAERRSLSKKLKTTNQWKKILRTRKDYSKENPNATNEWDYPIYAKVGSVLTSLLMHVAKVSVKGTDPVTGKQVKTMQPAFHHTYQFLQGQRLGVLKVHKSLIRQLAGNALSNAVQPQLLPMLVPPRPWVAYNDGGYLFSQNNIIRIKDSAETNAYLKAASDMGNLDQVYEGLNVLGETCWTINHEVFDVISHYWNSGEKFLDIPSIVEELDIPPPPPIDADPLQKTDYQRRLRQLMNDAASARSQRCDTNYRLEIARAFLGEKLYFSHNVDFRGRAYPLSPHFNHLGNDMTRSLFLFWDGKKVGARGLEWIKIHLANLYGINKAPLHERVQFVDDNLHHIIESAKNPLAEDAWWKKAEKPWQVLGVCFELKRAYDLEDPTEHISHLPIHQDGTCNGLQHYAALGGDFEGARQVNLIPADRPQDVYSFVASLVQKRVDAEAEAGNEYALFLRDKITRKVVKQTVMTNVYGVTFVGAVAQIQKQIDQYFSKEDQDKVADYSRYLTMLVFASMRELFSGAHLIQDWLGEAAKRISKSVRTDAEENPVQSSDKPSHLSSVIWTTPLGLPCVQPYRVTKKQIVHTNLQDIVISDPFGASQVDARKQQSAFPPNFVHSLDATHMLMTARACGQSGLAFAAVHDSYWTHACDVDTMNTHIREQFVALHGENLIVKLRDEFEKRYKGFLQVITIPGNHEVAIKIKEVRRGIVKDLGRALTVADEIYLENKRQQLLESDDPQMVEAGRQMVTTVSVTEGYDMNAIAVGASASKATQVLAPLTFPSIPPKGELDVKAVMDSPYFFS